LIDRLPGFIGLVPPPALDKSNITYEIVSLLGIDNNTVNQIDRIVKIRSLYVNIGKIEKDPIYRKKR